MLNKFALLACLLLAAVPAFAQNALTVGVCTTMATIENISESCKYTGDDNENATALVQFRASGAMSWIDAYTPFIDRRYTINGTANSRSREARVSIVGSTATAQSPVSPNTLYEVQITWTDADGVVGTNPVLTTVTTHPATPSLMAGATCTAPGTAIATCLAGLGTTYAKIVLQAAGSPYAPFTVSTGGTSATAYAQVEFESGAYVEYTSSASFTRAINITANYVWLKTPQFGATYLSGIRIAATGVYITDVDIPQAVSGCETEYNPVTRTGAAVNAAGIQDVSGDDHFVVGGTIASQTLSLLGCTATGAAPNNSPADGVHITTNVRKTLVYKNLTINGGFRDCFGTDGTSANYENNDFLGNFLYKCKDDGFDVKSTLINVRIAENHCLTGFRITGATSPTTDRQGITCFAPLMNSGGTALPLGPCYIHHNYGYPTGDAQPGYFYKAGGAQCFVFNNTLDGSLQGTISGTRWASVACISSLGGLVCHQWKSLNNINYSGGDSLDAMGGNLSANGLAVTSIGEYNYDIIQTTGTGSYIKNYDNAAGDYTTIAAFRTATGQEVNGLKANPTPAIAWSGGVGTITAGSNAHDAGTPIQNFNTSDSAWPYFGAAPDIGAFEVGGTTPPTLSSISPTFDTQGDTAAMTLTGTGFEGTDMGASTVVNVSGTGITQNTLSVVSDTSITVNFVIAADATASARNVNVTTTEGTSNNQTFTVISSAGAPTLTSISPSGGVLDSTVPVTLTGTNFNVGGGTVTESCTNISVSSIVVVNATTITALVFIASDASLAPCPFTVTTNNGQSNPQNFIPSVSGLGTAGRVTAKGGR